VWKRERPKAVDPGSSSRNNSTAPRSWVGGGARLGPEKNQQHGGSLSRPTPAAAAATPSLDSGWASPVEGTKRKHSR